MEAGKPPDWPNRMYTSPVFPFSPGAPRITSVLSALFRSPACIDRIARPVITELAEFAEMTCVGLLPSVGPPVKI
jgi:hypothetical protein